MSGTISQAVILRARIGPYRDARPKSRTLGSTISVWFEARDELTDDLLPITAILAATYWLPSQSDYDSQAQPVDAVQTEPGQWRVNVPTEMTGTYSVNGNLLVEDGDEVIREAAEIQFDVTSLGVISVISSGEIPWAAVQSSGAAAGASAGFAAGRVAGAKSGMDAAGPAALIAIAPVQQEIESKRQEVAANAADAAASEDMALGAADMARSERIAAGEYAGTAADAATTASEKAGEAAAAAIAAKTIPLKTISATSYTVLPEDLGTQLCFTANDDVSLILPPDLPAGFNVAVAQLGLGIVTPTAAAGGSVSNSFGDTSTARQYAEMLCKVVRNTTGNAAQWLFSGETA